MTVRKKSLIFSYFGFDWQKKLLSRWLVRVKGMIWIIRCLSQHCLEWSGGKNSILLLFLAWPAGSLSILSQMKAILIILPLERNCWFLLNIVMHPSWKDLPVCYTCSVHAQMAKLTFMVNMDAMWLPRWPFNELTTIFFGNKLDSRVSHL